MYKIIVIILSVSTIYGCVDKNSEKGIPEDNPAIIEGKEKSIILKEDKVTPTQKPEFKEDEVSYSGSLSNIMAGDLKGTIALRKFQGMPNIYALGAAEDLQGEIQIFNSQPVNSRKAGEMLTLEKNFSRSAALLVYAQVEEWREIDIPSSIKIQSQLEIFIHQEIQKAGLDVQGSYPFLVTGNVVKLDWHIVNWDKSNTDHSVENHMKYGLNGVMSGAQVEIIGFYSRNHKGIFTHHKSNVHMHFRTDEAKLAGHVDDMFLGPNMKLKLPKK